MMEDDLATLKDLETRRDLALLVTKQAKSDAGKANIEGLKRALNEIRMGYIDIPTIKHSNVVTALLAEHQGKERALSERLSQWENSEKVLKALDKDIKLCNERINNREKSVVFRRNKGGL